MRIEPSCGTLLMVDHKSLIPLPRLNSSTYLPVKIAGVNVMANGERPVNIYEYLIVICINFQASTGYRQLSTERK